MTETQVEKTVHMVAYDADESFESPRSWLEEITGEDLTSTTTRTENKLNVEFGLGAYTNSTTTISETYYQKAEKNKLLELADGDVLKVEEETETRTNYQNSPKYAVMQHILQEAIKDSVGTRFTAGGVQFETNSVERYMYDWASEDKTHKVKISSVKVDYSRVLAKESERDSDDMYETMAEVPSFNFRIHIDTRNKDVVEDITEKVITPLHSALSKVPDIGKVRYTDCTTTEVKEGDCYNI